MAGCPQTPLGASSCAEFLKEQAAEFAARKGERCEIVVSTAPPLVASPYGANGYTCPHGVDYWIEPTSDQVADWAARGTP